MEIDDFLTRRQVAVMTRLSVRTIDEHIARGALPAVRFGRAVRISRTAIRQWIAAHVQDREVAIERH